MNINPLLLFKLFIRVPAASAFEWLFKSIKKPILTRTKLHIQAPKIPNRSAGGTLMKNRYEELRLNDALNRKYDYGWACFELSSILRHAYSKLPRNLQAVIFRDVISAFRLLPLVQTNHGVSSANILVREAEATLPKQKRTLAVSEFKHAVVAYKRLSKAQQDDGTTYQLHSGLIQLPPDIVHHIFSFLDMRSIVKAGLTCWAWHSISVDNTLWHLQYSLIFGDTDIASNEIHTGKRLVGDNAVSKTDWKEAFKRKFIGNPLWKQTTHRAVCGNCRTVIWLSYATKASPHSCFNQKNQNLAVLPVSGCKVVDYLLGLTDSVDASSDSDDSDDDDALREQISRLWVVPRLEKNE